MESAVSLLAGIPSVVYGLVGMLVLVPGIRKRFTCRTARACSRPSSCSPIMILPSIIKVSVTALEAVPDEYEDASLALGATPESRRGSASPSRRRRAASPRRSCSASAARSARRWRS